MERDERRPDRPVRGAVGSRRWFLAGAAGVAAATLLPPTAGASAAAVSVLVPWRGHGGRRVERRRDSDEAHRAAGWAINFVHDAASIVTISTRDATVLDVRPAPNPGTRPVYGFAIASDDHWTYLFANNAPYGDATTTNYVARVRYGQLDRPSTYWNGVTWTAEADSAAPIHPGGTWANRLHVVRHGTRWLATCKHDEFRGTDMHILEAPGPTGPWTVIHARAITTDTNDDRSCTYDVRARPVDDTSLQIWWSNNADDERDIEARPNVYRPSTLMFSPARRSAGAEEVDRERPTQRVASTR